MKIINNIKSWYNNYQEQKRKQHRENALIEATYLLKHIIDLKENHRSVQKDAYWNDCHRPCTGKQEHTQLMLAIGQFRTLLDKNTGLLNELPQYLLESAHKLGILRHE